MDGLLHSEFALVLRDSLSSTPRRHVVCAPLSAPPPTKKRRLPEPNDLPSPQSPALSLPPQLALPSSPTPSFVSAESLQPQHVQTRLVPALHVQHPQLAKLQSTSHLSNAAAPVQSPTSVRGSIQSKTEAFSPSVYESVAPATPRPFSLDVLASVSAEQTQNETALAAPALSPITHPPRALHAPPTQQAIKTERLSLHVQPLSLTLPTTPVTPPPHRDLFAVATPAKRAALRQLAGIKRSGRAADFKNVRTRSFACTMCTSSFTERFNLNKHVRAVHERRRPFECPTCHARFQQRDHMQKHEMCVHKKLRQYLCVTCGASFGWRGVLKKHRKSVHNIMDS